MARKLIIFICLLFFVTAAWAGFVEQKKRIIMSQNAACNPCANLGGAELHIDFEHTTSNVTACKSGGTETGTLNGATISGVQAHTGSGTDCDGAEDEALLLDANDEDITFTNNSYFTSANGYLDIWVYPDSSANTVCIFDAYKDADDKFWLLIEADNTIEFRHENQALGGSAVKWNSTCTLADDGWRHLIVKWGDGANYDGSGAEAAISCDGGGSWDYEADEDDLAAFVSGEPTDVVFGEGESQSGVNTDVVYLDDIFLYTSNDGS